MVWSLSEIKFRTANEDYEFWFPFEAVNVQCSYSNYTDCHQNFRSVGACGSNSWVNTFHRLISYTLMPPIAYIEINSMLAYVRTKNVTESDMVSYQLREKVKWKRVKLAVNRFEKPIGKWLKPRTFNLIIVLCSLIEKEGIKLLNWSAFKCYTFDDRCEYATIRHIRTTKKEKLMCGLS